MSEINDWYKEEFEVIANIIKGKDYLNYCDFLRIRNFKINLSSRASKEQIKSLTKIAFKLAIEDKIEGVGIPIASAILAMKFPDKYAIIRYQSN